jgi:hypothetical protein
VTVHYEEQIFTFEGDVALYPEPHVVYKINYSKNDRDISKTVRDRDLPWRKYLDKVI